MARRTVSKTTPNAILQTCAELGTDPRLVFEKAGLSPGALSSPYGRITFEEVLAIWDWAHELTGDRLIGVETARNLPFGAFKVIDYMIASSETPYSGLENALEFYPIINEGFEILIYRLGEKRCVEIQNPVETTFLPFHYVDFVLACVLTRIRHSAGIPIDPELVELTCPKPPDVDRYFDFFRSPLKFQSTHNRMILPDDTMEIQQASADPVLLEILHSHAQQILTTQGLTDSIVEDLRHAICVGLKKGDARIEDCARELKISRRSLQRRLRLSGTSYQQILTKVRSDMAQHLLVRESYTAEHISEILGYSEPSTFYRAFKQWTGLTPGEFRSIGASGSDGAEWQKIGAKDH